MDYTEDDEPNALVTVVEMPEFISRAGKLLTDAEHDALINYLAVNPTAGDLIQGTGGIRKCRWALTGRGKRGGARVIHFFHNAEMPVFALTIFAKNERADLSQADRNDFRELTKDLVKTYGRKKR